MSNKPLVIRAHAWDVPIGICPCGWLVQISKTETRHTCSGCYRTLPVIREDGKEAYIEIHTLMHSLR